MSNVKKSLIQAVLRILNPLIYMLLRYEVSHSEFSELAKRVYVEVAFKHFTISNRKKTNSRVSVITGLSRKEVVRLDNLVFDEEPVTKGPLNRARRVIGGWLADSDFLDHNSEPRALALRGEENSFEDLATRYSGGITARAILDELIRVGAVVKLNKTTVELTHSGYVPQDSDADVIEVLSKNIYDHFQTSIHNLTQKETPRFQRQVSYTEMPASIAEEFQKLSHEKSSALLIELNQWLADKKKNMNPEPNEEKSRIGVGIYYIKNEEQ